MAEAVAAIGLASALLTFVNFGSKVLRQLRQLQQDASDSPKIFQGVRNRLPLMLDLVQKVMLQMDAGVVSDATQEHMLPLVRSCAQQVEQLHELVCRALPEATDSAWRRGRKAVSGVLAESEIQRIDAGLKANFDLLLQAGTFQSVNRLDRSGSMQLTSSFTMSPTVNVNLVQEDPLRRFSTGSATSAPSQSEQTSSYFDLRRIESHTHQAVFLVPFQRDSNFLGRRAVLDEIAQRFESQSIVALAGLGGIGKSQIAIEFSYVFRERREKAHIFWVYAGSASRFEQGYREIARKMAIPGWDDPKADKLDMVYSWMCDEENGEWLLILDNADDASMFFTDKSEMAPQTAESGLASTRAKAYARYLPYASSGRVLITTRDRRVGERLSARQKAIEVPLMEPSECIELLRSRIMEEDWCEADAARLAKELSYLPLAITQAAAFISENCITVSEYLDTLYSGDSDIKELLSEHLEDSRRELDSDNSVMRTWKISFDQISRTMPRAADILSLMTVLDFHGAPRSLLRRVDETETGFRTALGALQAFSLITVGRGKNAACKMHRLIALSTQKWLELRGTLDHWRSAALTILEQSFPETGWQTPETWASLEALLPHTQLILSYPLTTNTDLLLSARLLDACALYDMSKGKYEEALKKSRRSLDIREALLPPDDPARLQSVQTLGESLLHYGELQMAKSTLLSVISGRERILGPLHADTLESLSDLTITLLELDDLDAAADTSKRALVGREEVLGLEDRDTLVSLNLCAILLQRQGKLHDAKALAEKALNGRERVLGTEHPDTLITLNNLARLYYELGELNQAKETLTRVLAGEALILGAEGYDSQVSLTNMALVLQAEKDFQGAEALLRKVLAIRTRSLGPSHPSTNLTLRHLADLLLQSGHTDAAEAMSQRATAGTDGHESVEAGALLRAGLLFD